jgi:hypothetical protein
MQLLLIFLGRTNVPTQHKSEIVIFKTSDEKVSIDADLRAKLSGLQ